MRTSALNGWVSKPFRQTNGMRRPANRFARADFQHFDSLPNGFVRFSSLEENEVNRPDEELLAKARTSLASERNVSGLAKLRLQAGLSQKDLAHAIGSSQPRLSKWENGTEKPGFDNLRQLREALNVSYDELMNNLDG